MSLTVATNTGALMAQAAASSVNKEMEISMERLSTGRRINSASDDAAGVAIASRLTSNVRGLDQAVRNAMDAQALIDTAEGAQIEITNILQRMRELSVQAATDTNSVTDRAALQNEISALQKEVDRIASTTTWAGQNLLDGTFVTKNFQIGSGAGEGLTVSQVSLKSAAIGQHQLDGSASALANSTDAAVSQQVATNFAIVGYKGSATASFAAGATAKAVAAAVNANSSTTGVESVAKTTARISLGSASVGTLQMSVNGGGTSTAISANITDITDLTNLLTAINNVSGTTMLSAAYDGTDKSKLILTQSEGDNIDIFNFQDATTATVLSVQAGNYAGASAGWETAVVASSATTGVNDLHVTGVVRFQSENSFVVNSQAEAGSTAVNDDTGYFGTAVGTNNAAGGSSALSKVSAVDIGTQAGAVAAISVFDTAIQQLNTSRASLGAFSNRLDSTITNLTNISGNSSAAISRIQDADFASETTNLAKTQILQQAATAMLAQANASKQNVLSLLQG